VAYAVVIGLSRSEAAFDTARANDLDQRIDALQRQLKALQSRQIRADAPEIRSNLFP